MSKMPLFGITLIADTYVEVEADNEEHAIDYAYDIIHQEPNIEWNIEEVENLTDWEEEFG